MAMSLHEFGRQANCDYTTVSRLLSGDRAPSTRLLARICAAFGLDEGEALRVLRKDQARKDGKSPAFAAYLQEKVIDAPRESEDLPAAV
jgi:transcriptional regulator with XRE-family HTH domain